VSRRGVLPGDPPPPHSSRGHAPRRAVPSDSGAPSKAWFRDAYHLFGSKSSPCVATVGAHFAALAEPHRVRNPIVACGMLRKDWMRGGTDDTVFSATLACSRRAIIASVRLRRAATASRWASKPPAAASGKTSRPDLMLIEVQFTSWSGFRSRRTTQRDSSLHRLLTGHVVQRRPFSSRATSLHASPASMPSN
jgi:hypothetical protein